MHYLFAGLSCLFLVAFAGGRAAFPAAAVAVAAFGYAFLVYRWWVPPSAAAAAVIVALPAGRASRRWRGLPLLLPIGAVLAGFAVLGPEDGLF